MNGRSAARSTKDIMGICHYIDTVKGEKLIEGVPGIPPSYPGMAFIFNMKDSGNHSFSI